MIVMSGETIYGRDIGRCCFTKLNTNSSTKSSIPLIVPTVAAKSRRFNNISYLQPFMPYDCGICTYYGYHDPTTNYLVRTARGSIVNTNCQYSISGHNPDELYVSCVDDGTQKLKGYMYSSWWDDKISRTYLLKGISGLKFSKITMGTGVDHIYVSNMAIIRTKNMVPRQVCIPIILNSPIAGYDDSFDPPVKAYTVIGTSDGYTYYCVGDSYRENPTSDTLQNEDGYVARNLVHLKIQDTSKEASVQFCYTETALIMGEQPLNAY